MEAMKSSNGTRSRTLPERLMKVVCRVDRTSVHEARVRPDPGRHDCRSPSAQINQARGRRKFRELRCLDRHRDDEPGLAALVARPIREMALEILGTQRDLAGVSIDAILGEVDRFLPRPDDLQGEGVASL